MKTVIVTGSRDYRDAMKMHEVFSALINEIGIFRLAHGNARGADQLSEFVCRQHNITEIQRYDADWGNLGSYAGIERNERMLDTELELTARENIIVIAFPLPQSVGTYRMMEYALKNGVEVREIEGKHIDKLLYAINNNRPLPRN